MKLWRNMKHEISKHIEFIPKMEKILHFRTWIKSISFLQKCEFLFLKKNCWLASGVRLCLRLCWAWTKREQERGKVERQSDNPKCRQSYSTSRRALIYVFETTATWQRQHSQNVLASFLLFVSPLDGAVLFQANQKPGFSSQRKCRLLVGWK